MHESSFRIVKHFCFSFLFFVLYLLPNAIVVDEEELKARVEFLFKQNAFEVVQLLVRCHPLSGK